MIRNTHLIATVVATLAVVIALPSPNCFAAEDTIDTDHLEFGMMAVAIRLPTNKVVWAVTDSLPAQAAVLQKSQYPEPLFDVRELLSGLGVPDARTYDSMSGKAEWETKAGIYQINYSLAHGQFSYRFGDTGPEHDQPEAPERSVIREQLLELLRRSGFPTNELARNASGELLMGTREGTTSGRNPETKKMYTRHSSRGVSFLRWINGIKLPGISSQVQLEYRNDSIATLEIHWPAMTIAAERPVAKPQQVLRWLAGGRCAVDGLRPMCGPALDAAAIRSIKVTGASIAYSRNGPFDVINAPTKSTFPMLVLEVELTLAPGREETARVFAPAIDFGLPPAREHGQSLFDE